MGNEVSCPSDSDGSSILQHRREISSQFLNILAHVRLHHKSESIRIDLDWKSRNSMIADSILISEDVQSGIFTLSGLQKASQSQEYSDAIASVSLYSSAQLQQKYFGSLTVRINFSKEKIVTLLNKPQLSEVEMKLISDILIAIERTRDIRSPTGRTIDRPLENEIRAMLISKVATYENFAFPGSESELAEVIASEIL